MQIVPMVKWVRQKINHANFQICNIIGFDKINNYIVSQKCDFKLAGSWTNIILRNHF